MNARALLFGTALGSGAALALATLLVAALFLTPPILPFTASPDAAVVVIDVGGDGRTSTSTAEPPYAPDSSARRAEGARLLSQVATAVAATEGRPPFPLTCLADNDTSPGTRACDGAALLGALGPDRVAQLATVSRGEDARTDVISLSGQQGEAGSTAMPVIQVARRRDPNGAWTIAAVSIQVHAID